MPIHPDHVRFVVPNRRPFLAVHRLARGLAGSARVTSASPSTAVDRDRFVLSSHHSPAHQPRKDRFPMRRFISTLSSAVAALLLMTGFAAALPYNLSTPAGLNPGDKFRFIAVTPTTTSAASSNINSYNTFVQNAFGGATYGGVLINWKAIGSMTTINARDNVGGFGTDVPVYKPFTGTKVANNLTTGPGGLWSSALLSTPNERLNGTISNGADIWTGSFADGTRADFFNFFTFEQIPTGLGDNFPTTGVITTNTTDGRWIYSSLTGRSSTYQLYGLSEELTVAAPAPIPEIDPAGIASVLALVTGSLGLLERRRRSRR